MTYIIHESNTTSLQPGDEGYNLVDGVRLVPRAMLAIKHDCPTSIRDTLNWAIDCGYVVPIANVYKHEQTFNVLAGKA
jgi:hypothetical protein